MKPAKQFRDLQEWTLRPADDVEVCGPCAVVRWLKILNLAVTQLSTRTIAEALKMTNPVDHRSPHVCHTRPILADTTTGVPLLAGDLGAHRDLPVAR